MAGFWTGLLHGTLMCGATLAAISLAFPREGAAPPGTSARVVQAGGEGAASQQEPELAAPVPAGGVGPAAAPGDSADADVPAVRADAPDGAAQMTAPGTAGAAGAVTARPALEPLPEPIGSDFRRGWDDPPTAPAFSPAPSPTEVPRSVAAIGEAAPSPAVAPVDNPPMPVAPVAPAPLAPVASSPDTPATGQEDAPAPVAAPARVADPAPERLPERGGPDAPPAAGQAATDERRTVATVPLGGGSADAEQDGSPGMGGAPEGDALPTAPETPSGRALGAGSAGPGLDDVPEHGADSGIAAARGAEGAPVSPEAPRQPAGAEADAAAVLDMAPGEGLTTADRRGMPAAPRQIAPAETADRSMAALPDARPAEPLDNPASAPGEQAAGSALASSAAAVAPAWSPRPAPDLSIPPAFFGAALPSRSAPPLSSPDAATPPAPDLSDLNPGASR